MKEHEAMKETGSLRGFLIEWAGQLGPKGVASLRENILAMAQSDDVHFREAGRAWAAAMGAAFELVERSEDGNVGLAELTAQLQELYQQGAQAWLTGSWNAWKAGWNDRAQTTTSVRLGGPPRSPEELELFRSLDRLHEDTQKVLEAPETWPALGDHANAVLKAIVRSRKGSLQ